LPPLKRQKIGAASSSTDVSIDEMAGRRSRQITCIVEESLQLQKEDRTTIKDCNLPQFK
jgi:hypothetical protein